MPFVQDFHGLVESRRGSNSHRLLLRVETTFSPQDLYRALMMCIFLSLSWWCVVKIIVGPQPAMAYLHRYSSAAMATAASLSTPPPLPTSIPLSSSLRIGVQCYESDVDVLLRVISPTHETNQMRR
jgi:hypothetical protein